MERLHEPLTRCANRRPSTPSTLSKNLYAYVLVVMRVWINIIVPFSWINASIVVVQHRYRAIPMALEVAQDLLGTLATRGLVSHNSIPRA